MPSSGSKIALTERIEKFLRSETVETPVKLTRVGDWDSKRPITPNTPVINYKNDAKTKKFFVSQIGDHFHFNDYLRQFAKKVNSGDLTYGDLVKGWHEAEAKKTTKQKSTIAPQFQYNQFQRDFYANEKGKTRADLKAAWELVKSVPGPTTYERYVQLRTEMSDK